MHKVLNKSFFCSRLKRAKKIYSDEDGYVVQACKSTYFLTLQLEVHIDERAVFSIFLRGSGCP